MTRRGPRLFVTHHNFRVLKKTPEHLRKIGESQRNAWATKRQRMPIGATWKDGDGYIRVKVVEGKGNWRPQHLLVMEQVLGRPLAKREIVHHINGNREDNDPANLFLCCDRVHHNDVHRSQDVALRAMLAAGLVVFRDGLYEALL